MSKTTSYDPELTMDPSPLTKRPEKRERPQRLPALTAEAEERAAAAAHRRRMRTKKKVRFGIALSLLFGLLFFAVAMSLFPFRTSAPQYDCEVVKAYPHDAAAFCQGLVFVDGALYESTGQYGESTLRQIDLETGAVRVLVPLEDRFFGEGLTDWNGRSTLVQLTWKEKTGIVWDRATMRELSRFRYYGEGWGLTNDGNNLIQSDGSATLRFLDAKTFKVVRRLEVRDGGKRVTNLNELEYVEGEVYANVWHQDRIARISPRTGDVTGWIHLDNVIKEAKKAGRLGGEAIPNGIAYDAEEKRLFVTGKNWPKLFEVRLLARER